MTAASGPAPANVVAVQPVYCGGFTVTLHSGYLIRALTMGGGGIEQISQPGKPTKENRHNY